MAYITNDGARLIERARTEGRFIVFGSVRMNTVYKSDPTSLVQKTEEWYGENHGSVVGCISHVSVNGFSEICDSKLAVQCNDNRESWKSIGIYARLDGEEDEVLLACESIENGEYKDVTIVELPVTLDGVVEDFGLSEGGGGGGEVPANMMTTDTEQTGLSGMKQWSWEVYESNGGSLENPKDGALKNHVKFSINGANEGSRIPIVFEHKQYQYLKKEGIWHPTGGEQTLHISPDGVSLSIAGQRRIASWSNIIGSASIGLGVSYASISTENGIAYFSNRYGDRVQINPSNTYKLDGMTFLVINAEGQIAAVRAARGAVLGISAAVYNGDGTKNNVSGISASESDISFESPIPLVGEQNVYVHWTRIK